MAAIASALLPCSASISSATPSNTVQSRLSFRQCGPLGFRESSFSGVNVRMQERVQSRGGASRAVVIAMAPPKAGKEKKVVGYIKLALEAGKATPAPPVGPALGAKGVNIMAFCKEYNAKTADKAGYVIPVEITVFDDKSFTFILKTPPASILLLKACGAEKGSDNPSKVKVGKVTVDQVRVIAQEKLPDLNCTSIESAMRIVAGTAANMGIDIDPPLLEKKVKVVL